MQSNRVGFQGKSRKRVQQNDRADGDAVSPMPRIIPTPENVAPLIFLLRGEKVLLSQHLAELYGVSVSGLNQAVKRNIERFPDDFMFQLSAEQFAENHAQGRNQ
jgi:hypothetical protein